MPSTQPLPTIAGLLAGAKNALVGERDRYGDPRTGAIYDHVTGPMAILFAREADRDLDSFRAIYFDDADGVDLTHYAVGHFGIPRILDTYGVGLAQFARSSAAAGAGTFYAGSRIQVPGSPPSVYVVAEDTDVPAGALSFPVPIRAYARGTGYAVNTQDGLSLLDVAYDPLWQPTAIVCGDGTDFEDANTYRARARLQTLSARNGYLPELVTTCMNAGAAYVIAFPSQYGLAAGVFTDADLPATQPVRVTVPSPNLPIIAFTSPHGRIPGDYITLSGAPSQVPQLNGTFPVTVVSPTVISFPVATALPIDNAFNVTLAQSGGGDYGQNALYVADKNFASSATLVNACTVALEGSRVLGADLLVGGIVPLPLSIAATINLVDDPSQLQTVPIKRAAAQALLSYFGPTQGGYLYRLAAMGGAIVSSHPAIQSVTFSSPTTDPTLSPRAWPANIPRYTLHPRNIAFALAGPV